MQRKPQCPPLILGCPWILNNACYNAAILIEQGAISHVFTKRALPNYDVFDEKRYFIEGNHNNVLTLGGHHLLITICEDLWVLSPQQLIGKSLDSGTSLSAVINLSASPYAKNQQTEREKAIADFAKEANVPIAYCNQTGANTELIFDGKSGLYGENGPLSNTPAFSTFVLDVDTSNISEKLKAKAMGRRCASSAHHGYARLFFQTISLKSHLGPLWRNRLRPCRIYCMSRYWVQKMFLAYLCHLNSHPNIPLTTRLPLRKNLGMPTKTLPIQACFTQTKESLRDGPSDLQPITEENLQARLRGLLLMALANDERRVLLNTSNKSEAAVGYTTIYGDMCGGLSILGDVWKSEAYKLAQLHQ